MDKNRNQISKPLILLVSILFFIVLSFSILLSQYSSFLSFSFIISSSLSSLLREMWRSSALSLPQSLWRSSVPQAASWRSLQIILRRVSLYAFSSAHGIRKGCCSQSRSLMIWTPLTCFCSSARPGCSSLSLEGHKTLLRFSVVRCVGAIAFNLLIHF